MKRPDALVALVNCQSVIDAHLDADRSLTFEQGRMISRRLARAIDALAPLVAEEDSMREALRLMRSIADGRQITTTDRRRAAEALRKRGLRGLDRATEGEKR